MFQPQMEPLQNKIFFVYTNMWCISLNSTLRFTKHIITTTTNLTLLRLQNFVFFAHLNQIVLGRLFLVGQRLDCAFYTQFALARHLEFILQPRYRRFQLFDFAVEDKGSKVSLKVNGHVRHWSTNDKLSVQGKLKCEQPDVQISSYYAPREQNEGKKISFFHSKCW